MFLDIPEAQVDDYKIRHFFKPRNTTMNTSSARTAFCGGHRNKEIVFKERTRWHSLEYDGGTWMTDLPIEQVQCDKSVKEITGRVLIGGLGLGYAAKRLSLRKSITHIDVVEISKPVIDLVWKHLKLPAKVNIINANLFEYLDSLSEDEEWDYGFYDIWQSDGEGTFFNTVCPLREKTQGHIWDSQLICWNEDVMRGQLVMSLMNRILFVYAARNGSDVFPEGTMIPSIEELTKERTGNGSVFINWSIPFFQWLKDEIAIVDTEKANTVAQYYAGAYGSPEFERKWEYIKTHFG